MDRNETPFLDSLTRINFIYRNEEINTECVNNYERFLVLGKPFGPFEKGKKYRMKFFEAKPLIQNNILKIVSEDFFTNVHVQRHAIKERDSQQLVPIEQGYMLNKIKESKSYFEKEIEDGKKPRSDLDRYNSNSMNLIDSRLLKLLRLARSDLSLDDERRLTKSEKVLYQELSKLIKIWRTFFLK